MINYLKILKSRKKTIIAFAFIFLTFTILRVGRVLVDQQPVFGDEAIYIRWAQIMRNEPGLRFMPLSDGKQPLFMWMLIPLLKIIENPLFAGRLLSVLSGAMTLIGIFYLTYLIFTSRKAALFAALLYALSPFSVFFDSMALVDSMLSAFGIWVVIFTLLAVRHNRFDFAMLAGFSLGGALLTKSPAIYFSILIPSMLILTKWPNTVIKKIKHLLKYIPLFVPIYVIGYGMYNILRLGVNFQLIAERNKDYIFPINHLWLNPKDPFIFHIKEIINWFMVLGPWILIIFILLGLVTGIMKYRKEATVILVFILIPLFVNSMYAKVFTARYIFYVVPYIYILASLSILATKINAYLMKLMIILFVIYSLYLNYLMIFNIESAKIPKNERSGYLEEWTAGYGIKEVAQYLKDEVKNLPDSRFSKKQNSQIVVGTEGYFGTLPDGLQMYLDGVAHITVIGVGLDLKQVPQSLTESRDYGNDTYLVINNSRLKADPQSLDLKLIASYPKALRNKDNSEYFLYGPQEVLYFFKVE